MSHHTYGDSSSTIVRHACSTVSRMLLEQFQKLKTKMTIKWRHTSLSMINGRLQIDMATDDDIVSTSIVVLHPKEFLVFNLTDQNFLII